MIQSWCDDLKPSNLNVSILFTLVSYTSMVPTDWHPILASRTSPPCAFCGAELPAYLKGARVTPCSETAPWTIVRGDGKVKAPAGKIKSPVHFRTAFLIQRETLMQACSMKSKNFLAHRGIWVVLWDRWLDSRKAYSHMFSHK